MDKISSRLWLFNLGGVFYKNREDQRETNQKLSCGGKVKVEAQDATRYDTIFIFLAEEHYN